MHEEARQECLNELEQIAKRLEAKTGLPAEAWKDFTKNPYIQIKSLPDMYEYYFVIPGKKDDNEY